MGGMGARIKGEKQATTMMKKEMATARVKEDKSTMSRSMAIQAFDRTHLVTKSISRPDPNS